MTTAKVNGFLCGRRACGVVAEFVPISTVITNKLMILWKTWYMTTCSRGMVEYGELM